MVLSFKVESIGGDVIRIVEFRVFTSKLSFGFEVIHFCTPSFNVESISGDVIRIVES